MDENFNGFQNELTLQERDDLEIHKTQLAMDKDRELIGAEAEIDQQIDNEDEMKKLEDEKEALRRKLDSGEASTDEKNEMIARMRKLEAEMVKQREADARAGDRKLEERKKKRAQLLQIKKMQIEAKQLEDMNNKEIETLQNKFDNQIEDMDKSINKQLDKELHVMMSHSGKGKEKGLIMVNEAHDDLLKRKLKILMSKQFSDLTKYLGTMQNQVSMEHMIRVRQLKMKFENDKEAAIQKGLTPEELEQTINRLAAARDFEIQKSAEKMERDRIDRESKARQELEEKFCEEKKDIQKRAATVKSMKLQEVMKKNPKDQVMQDVGLKLLGRIEMTVEDQKAEADKEKEENVEKARIRIIADNEKQLEDLQKKLDEKMMDEEQKLNEQMNARRDQVLALKRQNLDDRIKMSGDLSQNQIIELRQQYEREFANVETAIRDEKEKQLQNMRSAMLNRRIAQERARRLKQEQEEAAKERERIAQM